MIFWNLLINFLIFATNIATMSVIGLQAGAITGLVAAFTESPIDFYKSQLQVQVIRSQADPNYKREWPFLVPLLKCLDAGLS